MDPNMPPHYYAYGNFGMANPFYQQDSANQHIFQLNSRILNLEHENSQMAQKIKDLML